MWRKLTQKALSALVALRKWTDDVQPPEPPVEVKFIESVHRGIGEPCQSIGDVGHWYLDQISCELWGPKTNMGWPDTRAYLLNCAMRQFNPFDQAGLDRLVKQRLTDRRRNKNKERFDV